MEILVVLFSGTFRFFAFKVIKFRWFSALNDDVWWELHMNYTKRMKNFQGKRGGT